MNISLHMNIYLVIKFDIYIYIFIYIYIYININKIGLYLAKLCSRDKHCTTASLIKVPTFKVGVYLLLEVHNTLFIDPT